MNRAAEVGRLIFQFVISVLWLFFLPRSSRGESNPITNQVRLNGASLTISSIRSQRVVKEEDIVLQTAVCAADKSLIGYADIDSIKSDLANGVTTFKLCPETKLKGSVVVPNLSNVTLRIECWDHSCVWFANKNHIRLDGQEYGFRASGISFRNATKNSIVLSYEVDSEPTVLIKDCSWEENSGSHTFMVSILEKEQASQRSLDFVNEHPGRHRRKSDVEERTTKKREFRGCTFEGNKAEELVSIHASSFSIMNCTFRNNKVVGPLIRAYNTALEITSTSFVYNDFNLSEGLVHLGGDAKTNAIEEVCTLSKDSRVKGCAGIVGVEGSCSKLPRCNNCVDSWDTLVAQVDLGSRTIELCANTTIDVPKQSPLLLDKSDTELVCGQHGLLSDGCVINGGTDQIIISASGIEIAGLTFTGSSTSSIRAEGESQFTAKLLDCLFSGHSGIVVISIVKDGKTLSSSNSLSEASEITDNKKKAMSIEITNCTLRDNKVDLVPILVSAGSLVVSGSVFQTNEGEVGVIGVFSESQLEISQSCFHGNVGIDLTKEMSSIVFVDKSSEIIRIDENFGVGNEVEGNNCSEGVSLMGKTCAPFTSRFCEAPFFDDRNVFAKFSTCINDFEALTTELSRSSTNLEIQICPLAVIDLGTKKSTNTIIIKRGNVTVKCGPDGSRENDCRVAGGKTQVEIERAVRNVHFKGLTFVESTKASVSIKSRSPLSVEFYDCAWERSKGESVVSVESLDSPTDSPTEAPTNEGESDDIFNPDENFGRDLKQTGFDVVLSNCLFDNNNVINSLLVVMGGEVSVSSCSFSSNKAGDNIVAVESGHLILRSTCFGEEGFLVSVDGTATVESERNYASLSGENRGKACSGVFDSVNEECTVFNATFCEAPLNSACYSDWFNLSQAVEKARALGEGPVFTLCQDTLIEADHFNPIQLDVDGIVIQCGSNGALKNRCSVTGGATQFKASGNVTFRGLNFLNASAAAIHAAGTKSKVVSIDNCVFSGHDGLAAVISYRGDIRDVERSRRLQQDKLPQKGASNTLIVTRSAFTRNDVGYAPLSAFGGALLLNATTFSDNSGMARAVGIWSGGNLQLSPSCFNGKGTIPSIYIDPNSTFGGMERSSASKRVQGDKCPGISFGTRCEPIAEQNCDLEIPPIPALGCYNAWIDLRKAMTSSVVQAREKIVFYICPDSVIDLGVLDRDENSPITIVGAQVEIKCGNESSRDDNCLIRGGRSHFKLEGAGTTKISGLTFEGASFASILANGDTGSLVTFTECTWRKNNGQTTILLDQQRDENEDFVGNIVDLAATSDSGMTILADKCLFENNKNEFAVITNIGGVLNLLETAMINNQGTRLGVVSAIEGARLGLSFTCLNGNSAIERGIVFVDKNSTLTLNKNTFGSDNMIKLDGECGAIFLETSGSCVQLGTCEGECQSFESKTCRVKTIASNSTWESLSIPSSTPSSLPSRPTSASDDVGEVSSSLNQGSGGGNKTAILAVSITGALLLLAVLGYCIVKRRRATRSEGLEKGKFSEDELEDAIGPTGGSQRRFSNTQEIGDDHDELSDYGDDEITDSLNPNKIMREGSVRTELIDDQDDTAEQMPTSLNDLSGGSRHNQNWGNRSWGNRSVGSKSPPSIPEISAQQTAFVRIPRTLGRKQRSEFQEIPTTF